jgi:hypothetical protein
LQNAQQWPEIAGSRWGGRLRSRLEYATESHKGGAPRIAMTGNCLPEFRRRYQREGCESGDPVVMQISSLCIDFGLGFEARYAKFAVYFKGRDEF